MSVELRSAPAAFRAIVTRLLQHWAATGRTARNRAPETARVQAALDMHELGVRLYRQRMHREHPQAGRDKIDDMVRAWLADPPRGGHLRLPSRERDRGIR
jgi:hypothetical protein